MVWSKNGTPNTLSSSGDNIDILDLEGLRYNEFMLHLLNGGGGNIRARQTFNNDGGSNYANRRSENGASDIVSTSQTNIQVTANQGSEYDGFIRSYMYGQSDKNKLQLLWNCMRNTAGSANVPSRHEMTPKWANILATINRRDILNDNVGTYAAQSNHSAFGDTGFVGAVGELGSWVELGRTILSIDATTIDVANLPNKRYYMLLGHYPGANIAINTGVRLGSSTIDAGTNYATRRSRNGGAENTFTNSNIGIQRSNESTTFASFMVSLISNLSANEKLGMMNSAQQQAVGSATAPSRHEGVGKWVNTSNPLDIIRWHTQDSINTFDVGTELIVLGWTPSDLLTTESNFWQPLGEIVLGSTSDIMKVVIAPKKYLWVQSWGRSTVGGLSVAHDLRFNDNVTTAYSHRLSFNGGADSAVGNDTRWNLGSREWFFMNCFIVNNSTQEKLGTGRINQIGTVGAGTAPDRVEFVGKWSNTVSPISAIAVENDAGAVDYQIGSFLRVWGHD